MHPRFFVIFISFFFLFPSHSMDNPVSDFKDEIYLKRIMDLQLVAIGKKDTLTLSHHIQIKTELVSLKKEIYDYHQ